MADQDVNWALLGGGAAVALALIVAGVILFLVLWKHMKGKIKPLDPWDAGQVAIYGQTRGIYQAAQSINARGVGAEATLKINIDTLRKARQRGDWKTFWLWPLSMTCIFVGVLLAFWTPMLVFDAEPALFLAAAFWLVFPLFIWFMAWAAVYTKIDLGADDEPGAGAAPKAGSRRLE